jgi:hypothetical protein
MATGQMSLPAGFKLETEPSVSLPAGFSLETPQKATPNKPWGVVAAEAVGNFLPSVGQMAVDVGTALMNPIDTAQGVLDLGAGTLQNIVPTSVKNAINKIDFNPEAAKRAEGVADAVGGQFKQNYGSVEGFKDKLSRDPAGVLADASTVLTGGSTVVPRLGKVASAIDPMVLALRGGEKVVDVAAPLVKNTLGMTTGAGGESISQAYQAGKSGGPAAQSFRDNLTGKVPYQNVIDTAQRNLENMKISKNQAYKSGMIDVSNDKTVLNFGGVDKALSDAAEFGKYKGQVTNPKAAEAIGEAAALVENWKKLDPAEFHTPEGFDKLKQSVGAVLESIPLEQRQARTAVQNIYTSITSEIKKQAPTYEKTMREYGEAAEVIKELEKALSLGPTGKFSADTAMRKLQSLMRNSVNTNYGNRLDLARQLEVGGGQDIMPALAGQSLSSPIPRGLQGTGVGGSGIATGAVLGGLPGFATGMALASPRIVGEGTFRTGQLVRGLRTGQNTVQNAANAVRVDPRVLANALYQSQQIQNAQPK